MTTQKASLGTLRILRTGGSGDPVLIATAHGRGIVEFSARQRTLRRTAATGRSAERPQEVFDVVLSTTLLDNAAVASLFGWFEGNGQSYDVDWRPAGDGSGLPKITFTGDCFIDGSFAAQRTRRLRITASGGFIEGSQ